VDRRYDRPRRPVCRRRGIKGAGDEPADHAPGRSRGRFSTKIHLLCDRAGHPLGFHLTAGQSHESQSLETLLEETEVVDFAGERIAGPLQLAGDKGYRAEWIDESLLESGIAPVIPSKANQDRDVRLVGFDREACRERNIIEPLIDWFKDCRRILTRFEKTATNDAAMIKMAFIHHSLRILCR